MAYSLKIKPSLDKLFRKIAKRDPVQYEALQKKIMQILDNPHRFKPLTANMRNKYRVHIYSSFVLVYEVYENEKMVELWD